MQQLKHTRSKRSYFSCISLGLKIPKSGNFHIYLLPTQAGAKFHSRIDLCSKNLMQVVNSVTYVHIGALCL